jgi:hypothetical protein
MPWMKLFTEDLDRDCSALSLAARGAWIWIFLDLRNHGGSRSLSLAQWASVVRASPEETAAALDELIEQNICDSSVTVERYASVTEALRRNGLSQKYNGLVTLTSRRILRESKVKNSNCLRQARHRASRQRNTSCNEKRNADIDIDIEADIEEEAEVCVCSSSGRRDEITEISTGQKAHTHTAAADFILTEELQKFVETGYPELDPEAQAEKFRNYFGRNGKTFPDIDRAFRSWIQEAEERRQHRAREPNRPVRESVAEHNARVFAELNAMSEDEIRVMQGLEPRGGKPP